MIGPRCTRDTFCQTIAKTSANDLLDKCKFCQNGQIFKGADVLPQAWGGGGGGPIFVGYVPLVSQNPYPIIVIFYGQL